MKAATVSRIKKDISIKNHDELVELCLRLAKFKKENKELLTYLLYEADDEAYFVENVKTEMANEFSQINIESYYYIKKSVRKILRTTKKYIRYSKQTRTELDLLIYFCALLKDMHPPMERDIALHNFYDRQIGAIQKKITKLHEDLQYDYTLELEPLL